MKLKIVSDGTAEGTRLVSLDGRRVQDVRSIKWEINAERGARATVELEHVPVEIVGSTKDKDKQLCLLTCPICEVRFLMDTEQSGRYADYKGTNTRWECGSCKKKSFAEDWFSTEGMN